MIDYCGSEFISHLLLSKCFSFSFFIDRRLIHNCLKINESLHLNLGVFGRRDPKLLDPIFIFYFFRAYKLNGTLLVETLSLRDFSSKDSHHVRGW